MALDVQEFWGLTSVRVGVAPAEVLVVACGGCGVGCGGKHATRVLFRLSCLWDHGLMWEFPFIRDP